MSGTVVSVSDAEITSNGKSQRQIKLTDLRGHALPLKQHGSGAEVDDIDAHDKLSVYFASLQPGIGNEKDGTIWLVEEALIKKEGGPKSETVCFVTMLFACQRLKLLLLHNGRKIVAAY